MAAATDESVPFDPKVLLVSEVVALNPPADQLESILLDDKLSALLFTRPHCSVRLHVASSLLLCRPFVYVKEMQLYLLFLV